MKSSTIENQTNNYLQIINANMSQHFIFNTLNSINSFIIDNNAKIATDYVSKFGKLLRLILEISNKKLITLNSEIEALELYLFMEKMRYQDAFEVRINIAENVDILNTEVPSLLLQPYIESIIWQNISNNPVQQNIIVDVQLKGKNSLEYCITNKKSNIKPKLFQAVLPHQTKANIDATQNQTEQNNSAVEVKTIHLYNDSNEIVAQKTIITLTIIKA